MEQKFDEGLEKGQKIGFDKGLEEGLEQGKAEGEKRALLRVAETLLNQGFSLSEVQKILKLSEEELLQLVTHTISKK